jgi:hypothetical protein
MKKKNNLILTALFVLPLLIHKIPSSHAMRGQEIEPYGNKFVITKQSHTQPNPEKALYSATTQDTEIKRHRNLDRDGNVTDETESARVIVKQTSFCSERSIILGTSIAIMSFILYQLFSYYYG